LLDAHCIDLRLEEHAIVQFQLPVVRSATRTLLLTSAAVTVGILLWTSHLRASAPSRLFDWGFFVLFAVYDYWGAICALLILICAAFVPVSFPFRRILRWTGEHPVVIAVVSAIILSLGTLLVYKNFRLSADEYVPFFQSQVFAAGRLTGQIPPPLLDWAIPKGFQNYFLNVSSVTGRVASSYWPSFALLLTPFTWLGIPWACNPVISACTVLAIHRLTLRLFNDVEAAGLAVLLTVASPVFLADGISYYSMPAHLLANTVYALLLLQPTAKRAFAAGLVGSVALTLHNPYPHLLFAIPWAIWLITRERGLRLSLWMVAGYLPLCLLLGVGWLWLSQDLLREGLNVAGAAVRRVGSTFTKPNATILIRRLAGLSKLWLWAVPGLPLLAAVGAWKWRHDARCLTLAASAVTTLAGYMIFWADQGHGWGYRYFHSAWMVLPVLGAGALICAPSMRKSAQLFASDDTRAFVVACALLTMVIGVPLRAWQMHGFITEKLEQAPAYSSTSQQIVFIRTEGSFYAADLVQNDPFLRGRLIRMASHGNEANERMMHEYFPGYHRLYSDAHGETWSVGPEVVATGDLHTRTAARRRFWKTQQPDM
jgi:hypothetical protein